MKYLPQEIVLYYLFPSIRREMTLYLKQKNYNNKEIAKILSITPSAVSQYLKNKRSKFYFEESFKNKIHKKTEQLLKKYDKIQKEEYQNEIVKVLNELVEISKKSNVLCKIHKKIDKVPEKCNLC